MFIINKCFANFRIHHHFYFEDLYTMSIIGFNDVSGGTSCLPYFCTILKSVPDAPFIFRISILFYAYTLKSNFVSGMSLAALQGNIAYLPGSNLCQQLVYLFSQSFKLEVVILAGSNFSNKFYLGSKLKDNIIIPLQISL